MNGVLRAHKICNVVDATMALLVHVPHETTFR